MPDHSKGKVIPIRPRRLKPIKDAATLAREQGIQAVEDPTTLLGDFWPEEEDIEEFLDTLERWRHEQP
ncbi:MAG: hypothetical protein IT210_19810 [Armatimonadetes bacterium]|nr:hypothetical protein [Armatimonadota bacterium]